MTGGTLGPERVSSKLVAKPPTCLGCPLHTEGEGFMEASLATNPYGVALVGEALGEDEAEQGKPFVGRAGFKLTQLIGWAGLDRGRFDIWNTVWCRPPGNLLEGQPYEHGSISHCRVHHWNWLIARNRVVVPMGNVALGAFTGRKGILAARGYVSGGPDGAHLLPTVHPSFIQRGQSKYCATFIHDLQKAVELARTGLRVEPVNYLLDPSPQRAYEWALEFGKILDANPSTRLAFDIETPGKGEDEGDLADDDDPTYTIHRIGFSFAANDAMSIPWTPPYMAAIRLLMESKGEKVVWNASFDCPRIKANGVGIGGLVHDGMVAWHVLHSDLPKGLAFVATFTCPWQPAWKHLSHRAPAFYNATDADVEWRSMEIIERELKLNGLWDVYEADVVKIDPILVHMSERGMPVDSAVRLEKAIELDRRLSLTVVEMEVLVPQTARRLSPKEGYAKAPKETDGLVTITVEAVVKRCDRCGQANPTAAHFRTFKRPTAKKPQNPCAGASKVEGVEPVERFARLEPFKPSREQLIRYNRALGRALPTVWDKKTQTRKVSMNEKGLKELIRKFPLDTLYPLVLTYRELDKLAGTYIGRPAES